MKKCVFSGTFDPPTTGHEKIIEICRKIFDEVVVAVMINRDKTPLFTVEERLALLNKMYRNCANVKICAFEGAAVDLLERENTPFYVRGVRDCLDLDYENRNYFASKKLKEDLVEIYIPADQDSLHVSSSLIRNSVAFKKRYSAYIPAAIKQEVEKLLKLKG